MPTRNQFTAARLAKLHPDEAYQIEQSMTVSQRRALYAELDKQEYFQLSCAIDARRFVDALNAAVREEALMEAKMAPQLERERAARRAAWLAAHQ